MGVFPIGRTTDGADDLSGNVYEWTSSLFGEGAGDDIETQHPYPYDPADGREDAGARPSVRRVVRGGGWRVPHSNARAAFRDSAHPDDRDYCLGFRIVVAASPGS